MLFQEYVYERPQYELVKVQMDTLTQNFMKADTAAAQIVAVSEYHRILSHLNTMETLCSIRYSINTEDDFYKAETDFWDEHTPLIQAIDNAFKKAMIHSPYLPALKEHFPPQYFTLIELSLRAFDESIVADLQKENALSSKYRRLIAAAQIVFEGKTYTLSQLVPLTQDKDRSLRERAIQARIGYYAQHEAEIDEIYDEMVKVRTEIAHKLGYKNFVELGYVRMYRSDYGEKEVMNYRRQVLEQLVPLTQTLYEEQANRLQLDHLRYYDEKYIFDSGNPTPKGTPEWILENGKAMYAELSKETDEFFTYMCEHNLLDLVNKKGKAGGGFCTYINDYHSPFIFSNFNGTSGDVDVLTHEAGHAFQVYQSRDITIPDCVFSTNDGAEIHSMSMEFFTYPWMSSFFQEDTDKYYYMHLSDAIKFIPYGITVDAFQHAVYENPTWTPKQRKEAWRSLERSYLPHKDYAGIDFLEQGTWWFQQSHIFEAPFYYIDYTLAQVCALQFYVKSLDNFEEAWKDYLHLCKLGGTKSFVELIKEANLMSPFENGCMEQLMEKIKPIIAKYAKGSF